MLTLLKSGIDDVIAELVVILSEHRAASDSHSLPAEVEEPDIEANDILPLPRPIGRTVSTAEVAGVSARLRREVKNHIRRPTTPIQDEGSRESSRARTPRSQLRGPSRLEHSRNSSLAPLGPVPYFQNAWDRFAHVQTDAIINLIKDGSLGVQDVLRIEAGMPSLQSVYADRLPKAWTSSLVASTPLGSAQAQTATDRLKAEALDTEEADEQEAPCSEALTKAYSLLFGLGQLTTELCELHTIVCAPRDRRLHFHILEARSWCFWRSSDVSMSLHAALASLRGGEYTAPAISYVDRFVRMEQCLRSDRSLCKLVMDSMLS